MVKWKMKKNTDTSEAVNHCIVCDIQLLMYHCSFSVFIWPLNYLWFTASDVSVFFFMKNEKEQWYIRSCKSQAIQWSNEKWKRTMIHQKLLITDNARFTASDVSLFFFIFHLTIALSVIYSFWFIIVLFHFSFDHCIIYDLQLLMYECSGQMKNEKEQWYIRSCKSQKIQWSNEKWKRTLIHQKL
jgi:hypothetical protein